MLTLCLNLALQVLATVVESSSVAGVLLTDQQKLPKNSKQEVTMINSLKLVESIVRLVLNVVIMVE